MHYAFPNFSVLYFWYTDSMTSHDKKIVFVISVHIGTKITVWWHIQLVNTLKKTCAVWLRWTVGSFGSGFGFVSNFCGIGQNNGKIILEEKSQISLSQTTTDI